MDNEFQNGKSVADEIKVLNYVKPKVNRGSIKLLVNRKLKEEKMSKLLEDPSEDKNSS